MSAYKQDPNDSNKQIPQPLPDSAFAKVTTPTPEVIHEAPSSVIVNVAGTYAFAYNLTGSIGAAVTCGNTHFSSSYITGSVMAAEQGNLKLDIQPNAWASTGDGKGGGSVGDITFVYRGRI